MGSQICFNLSERHFSCGEWRISGIPSKHVTFCMRHTTGSLPSEDEAILEPPPLKRLPGRPRRNRGREDDEPDVKRRSSTLKCSICGNYDHNRRTCQGPPVAIQV
ncbi:hypothetical protein ACFE04_005828 [Oxalis oulophora]